MTSNHPSDHDLIAANVLGRPTPLVEVSILAYTLAERHQIIGSQNTAKSDCYMRSYRFKAGQLAESHRSNG